MPSKIKKKPTKPVKSAKKPATKKPATKKPATKKPATKSKFGGYYSTKKSDKKKKATRKMSKSKSSSSSECIVCMDSKAVKSLNPYDCLHKGKMCQSCTTKVAQTTNKCPLCRRQNRSLLRTHHNLTQMPNPNLSLPVSTPLLRTNHNVSRMSDETLHSWVSTGLGEFEGLDQSRRDYNNPQYRGNRNINFLHAINDRQQLVYDSMSIADAEIRLREQIYGNRVYSR